jgi:hypothetical protein
MRFFVPGNTPRRSKEVYDWIVRYVEAMLDCKVEPVHIFSLDYRHEGQELTATVGELDPRTGQLVVAILRAGSYLICTPYYGVERGEPISIAMSEAVGIRYFTGLGNARENLKLAVNALDLVSVSIQERLQAAAAAIAPVTIDDFPSSLIGDFLSLTHKLSWKGSPDDTVRLMTNAEAEDAAAAIKALYVDVLSASLEPTP